MEGNNDCTLCVVNVREYEDTAFRSSFLILEGKIVHLGSINALKRNNHFIPSYRQAGSLVGTFTLEVHIQRVLIGRPYIHLQLGIST